MDWRAVAGISAAGAAAAAYYALSVPSSQVLGPALVRGRTSVLRVALTFDDGPAVPSSEQILDILRAEGAPAAFFVCGKNVDRFPSIVRRMRAEGHTVGNHTYSHPALYFKSRRAQAQEIDTTQESIERATGLRPRLFRPPYGARWFGLFPLLAERQLKMVLWSAPSFDWKRRLCAAEIVRRTLRALKPGAVILLHDGREPRQSGEADARVTVEALPGIIEGARRAGFEFVSIEEFI